MTDMSIKGRPMDENGSQHVADKGQRLSRRPEEQLPAPGWVRGGRVVGGGTRQGKNSQKHTKRLGSAVKGDHPWLEPSTLLSILKGNEGKKKQINRIESNGFLSLHENRGKRIDSSQRRVQSKGKVVAVLFRFVLSIRET